MGIEVRNLGVSYGNHCVFKDINLDINEANLTCILGPNGVGKSTFMYCLNKLLKPTEGTVTINDPMEGIVTLDLEQMKETYDEIGRLSMTIKDKTA